MSRATPWILTLDVGTSSVRAMIYDATGNPVAGLEAHRAHQMRSTADGGVETDAEALLERAALCIDEVLARAGAQAPQIAAVAPTTFWHNVLGVDARARPITPLYTWADTRSAAAAAALRRELDVEQIHDRTGCVLHPSYLPAKLRWLQQSKPGLSRRAQRWLSFAEFMTLRLYGSPSCSISMASGSGLLDQHRREWDAELLTAIPVAPERLSPLSDVPRQGLRPEWAARWPALAQLPWFPGWGDGAMSNVGAGCVSKRSVAVMVGTSGAMRAAWPAQRFTIPRRLWCYRIDARHVVMGGALSNGGNLIDWLQSRLAVPDEPSAFEAAVAAIEPDSHGLTILPFLAGERSPNWVAEARATISGLTLHTQPAEIARAGLEAVAYRFGLIHELLKAAVPQARTVVASGGALLHSPTWLQIMADVLGCTVTASSVAEASSRGAALMALEALGAIPGIDALPVPHGATYQADRARVRRYRQGAARQRALYDTLVAPLSQP